MAIPAPSTNLDSYFALFASSVPIPGEPFHPFTSEVVDWDTSAVTSMVRTFSGTLRFDPYLPPYLNPFNYDISGWDTGSVTNMAFMFQLTSDFNQDIGGWDTGQVTWMDGMFSRAAMFNQDISGWDVSNVRDMSGMFFDAVAFDQDLGAWDITSLSDGASMFDGSGMSMANFDATIAGWLDTIETAGGAARGALTVGADGLVYSNIDDVNTFRSEYNFSFNQARYYLAGTTENDVLDGSDGAYRIVTDGLAGDDLIIGNARNDELTGGLGLDTLIGGEGDDLLLGGGDAADLRDVIYAGAGNDSADGGYGNDELRGDAGNDTLLGGFGADTLIGGADDDVLTGSALSDLIFGGDGGDFLNGGYGHDRLNGGAGADRFFHTGDVGHGTDWVQDFDASQGDVLLFGGTGASADDFHINLVETTGAGIGAAEAFVTYLPTGQILWALVDGGSQSEINLLLNGATIDLLA